MTQDRIRRLLRLVTLMQSGRRCNVRSMCTSLEVSRRTLFRDLSVLQDAGIQYVYDGKEKTYTMESSVLLQPVNLTVAETLAALGLIRKLLPEQMLPDFHAARRAATKIESMLPPHISGTWFDQQRLTSITLLPATKNVPTCFAK